MDMGKMSFYQLMMMLVFPLVVSRIALVILA